MCGGSSCRGAIPEVASSRSANQSPRKSAWNRARRVGFGKRATPPGRWSSMQRQKQPKLPRPFGVYACWVGTRFDRRKCRPRLIGLPGEAKPAWKQRARTRKRKKVATTAPNLPPISMPTTASRHLQAPCELGVGYVWRRLRSDVRMPLGAACGRGKGQRQAQAPQ